MYDELVNGLRELQQITANCNDHSCFDCENRDLCDKYDNKTLSETYKQAADAIEELSKLRWIPVTERLPESDGPVLVTYIGVIDGKQYSDLIACVYEGVWCYWDGWPNSYDKCKCEITHWMPLTPPKEE